MIKTLPHPPHLQYEIFLPFQLGDPAGIVFFAHVFSLAHQVYEQFILEKLDIKWDEWFHHSHRQVPIVSTEAHYCSPLHAGQTCLIELKLLTVGKHSFAIHYTFIQKKICCSVKTVHVFCDALSQQKILIPPFIREKLVAWHHLS